VGAVRKDNGFEEERLLRSQFQPAAGVKPLSHQTTVRSKEHFVKGGLMAQPALGFLLQKMRESRGLSLRDLALLAGTDHAYIYRLETGDKEAPSEEVLSKLLRALKPGKREAEMLRYIASHTETDSGLVAHVLVDPSVSIEVFTAAAGAVYRGAARPDYAKLVERVRRILSEEDSDG
jgi:HTH-type transcriptional regulator, competence development regulator